MTGVVLILAYHPACLMPVFGEPALCRLARLAASLSESVHLWMTPAIHREMGKSHRCLPVHLAIRVLPPEDLSDTARQKSSALGTEVLVLPGHSVWDRLSLKQAMDFQQLSLSGMTAAAV